MSAHPIRPLEVHLQGMSGTCMVRFLAVIPHGRGTREVAVDVAPEVILRIADALRATAGPACDTPTSRIADEGHPAAYHVGHAIWHVDRPGEPMPCVDRGGALDVRACARLEGASPPDSSSGFSDDHREAEFTVVDECGTLDEGTGRRLEAHLASRDRSTVPESDPDPIETSERDAIARVVAAVDAVDAIYAIDDPAWPSFVLAMRGRAYGWNAISVAWIWYRDGWRAKERATAFPAPADREAGPPAAGGGSSTGGRSEP